MSIKMEDGQYGARAVLRSEWSERDFRKIRSRQCAELEINYAKGWSGSNLSFLALLPSLVLDFGPAPG
ncbi:MAG: hypothetical protein ACC655_11970, partial [Rhodothermia bacterium]